MELNGTTNNDGNVENNNYKLINEIINNADMMNINETTIVLMRKLKHIFNNCDNCNNIAFINPKKFNDNEQFGKFIIKTYEYINNQLAELNKYDNELINFVNNFTNWLLIQQKEGNFGKPHITTGIYKQHIEFFKIEESINQDADEDDDGYEIINFIIDGKFIESIDAIYSINMNNKIYFNIVGNKLCNNHILF